MYLTEEQKKALDAAKAARGVVSAPSSAAMPEKIQTRHRSKLDLNALRKRVAPSTEREPADASSTITRVEAPVPQPAEESKPASKLEQKKQFAATDLSKSKDSNLSDAAVAPLEDTKPGAEPGQQASTDSARDVMPDSLDITQIMGNETVIPVAEPHVEQAPEVTEIELDTEETPAESAPEPTEQEEIPTEFEPEPAEQEETPAQPAEVLNPELKTGSLNVIDLPTLLGLLAPNGGLFDQCVLTQWIGKCLVKYNQAPTNIFSARFDAHIRFVNFNYLDNRINVVVAYGDNVVCLAYSQSKQELKDVSQNMVAQGDKVYYREHLMATYSELSRKTLEV